MVERRHLFSDARLFEVLNGHRQKVAEQIRARTFGDLGEEGAFEAEVNHWVEEGRVEPIRLMLDQARRTVEEIDLDARGLSGRIVIDRSRPVLVKGLRIRHTVPYVGDHLLLKCCPSRFTASPPYAETTPNSIAFVYEVPLDTVDPEVVDRFFEHKISELRRWVDWSTKDVEQSNSELPRLVRDALRHRIAEEQKQASVIAALGASQPAPVRLDPVQRPARPSVIRPSTPYSNVRTLRELLHSLEGWCWWYEPHMPVGKVLDLLADELPQMRVSQIRLLSGPANLGARTPSDVRRAGQEWKSHHDVSLELRVLSADQVRDHHDRFIVGKTASYNVPPLNTWLKGSTSEVRASQLGSDDFMAIWGQGVDVSA